MCELNARAANWGRADPNAKDNRKSGQQRLTDSRVFTKCPSYPQNLQSGKEESVSGPISCNDGFVSICP